MTSEVKIELKRLQLTNPLNGNKGGHWGSRAKKAKEQRLLACIRTREQIWGKNLSGPLTITITRLSSGTLDDDALPASAKHVRDGIADALKTKDNHPRLTWKYAAEKVKRGVWGVHISIYKTEKDSVLSLNRQKQET